MNIPKSSYPRVVIIGGGFGGISLARNLKNLELQVVMLDKHNYHTFQPLLYQVSTGGLEPDSIAYPIRKVLQDYEHFYFRLAQVKKIKPTQKLVETDIGPLSYDYLVLATGSVTNYFGNTEIEENGMAMKSIPQSLNLRSLILENFERALLTDDLRERDALMCFVIVGGGPTGVELAGALAEIKKGILHKDYPDLDTGRMQINLIQSGDRILKEMSPQASEKAESFLNGLGVKVLTNVRVTGYDGKVVTTKTDLRFESATLVWAAGVKAALVHGLDAENLLVGGRIRVNEFNQVLGHPDIFAIGDVACMVTGESPNGQPMMAQPAMQQGKQLGENFARLLDDRPLKPFEYKDKGSMATVGRNKAVVDLPKFRFQGVFAWFVWMFVHLFFLIGFRNRVVVFINWVYNYIRFDREARLIIRPFKKDYSHYKS
ncbi:MAG: NAD(P)/FAD-dependent oxidoreductase [Flavobacteriaceae bacterium]